MAVDLYFAMESNPYYNSNSIEVIDELEMFLQQVEILLTTPEESMLGTPDFGCALEKFLWSPNTTASGIKKYIEDKIQKYVVTYSQINFSIDVNFIQGEVVDSILIDIIVDGKKVSGYLVNP